MTLTIINIFSYWIFTWYLLYIGNYTTYSPKIAFILAILYILGIVVYLLYYKIFYYIGKYETILYYFVIQLLIKIIPLYTIWKDKYKTEDFVFLCYLFLLYNIWLYLQNKNVFQITDKIFHSILYGKNETQFMYLFTISPKNTNLKSI